MVRFLAFLLLFGGPIAITCPASAAVLAPNPDYKGQE
jgi:hypothetical protein